MIAAITPQAFHPFSSQHYAALAVGAVVAAAFLLAGKRGEGSQRRATLLLAFINFSVYPLSLAAWLSLAGEKEWDNLLPFHLCDVAAIVAGLALVTRRPLFCALTYFWGLAATIQGLITPALTVGFPAPPFMMFFVHHFAVVIAALYLPIVTGWRPKLPIWKTPLEVMGWSLLYLLFAMTMNRLLGSNFAFASHKPFNPSLIDHLGPWPWYLFSMLGLATVFYLLLALPFLGRVKR